MDTLDTSGVGHNLICYPLVQGQHIITFIILTTLVIMDRSLNFGTACLEQILIMSNLNPKIKQILKSQSMKP